MKKFFLSILVLVIISFSWATYKLINTTGEDPRFRAKRDIHMIESRLLSYRLDNGFFPTIEQGLSALIKKPTTDPLPKKWRENGYLPSNNYLIDPWGNNYIYSCTKTNDAYVIITLGKDGKVGGNYYDKDIHNWEL